MAILHTPPDLFQINPNEQLYFLAGPIQGAPDWQDEAAVYIDQLDHLSNVHIASPRWKSKAENFNKPKQITWEKHYLKRAALHGGILFYLAAQDHSLEYREGRAYAQTTRLEFGRAMGWLDHNPLITIAIGMEPGYKGNEDYYLHSAAEFGIPVRDNLMAACEDLHQGRNI